MLAIMFRGGRVETILPSVVDHASHQTGPTTLVGSTESTATVAVEELVEPKIVLPVRVEVQKVVSGVDATTTLVVTRHQVLQTMLDLLGDVAQMHVVATARGTLDLELVSVEQEESLKRLNQKEVDTQPNGASPVTVATK